MRRWATILLLAAISASLCNAQGSLDPVFSTVPFNQWFETSAPSPIRWVAGISEPALSTHQRLVCNTQIRVDGADLAKRRGRGELQMFVQVSDARGHVWQNHDSFGLEPIEESIKTRDIQYIQPFFVLPGDYVLSLAIYDTASHEHGVARRKLHVSPLRKDPLPGAWQGLPAVEFLRGQGSPDAFYLPLVETRLNLPVATRSHVEIDLLVNLTPSERFSGSNRAQNRNYGVLLPLIKLLSSIDWRNASFNFSLIDLFRMKTVFSQKKLKILDWPSASESLGEAQPGLVDIKTLENRKQSAGFFVGEVNRLVAEDGPARVLIILTSAVTFEPGMVLRPAEATPHPNLKIYYLRYQPLIRVAGRPGGSGGLPDYVPPRPSFGAQADQLEPLLRGLNPRRFDFSTPDQFRKALAAVIGCAT